MLGLAVGAFPYAQAEDVGLEAPEALLDAIADSPFEEPIHLVSEERRDRAEGHVYAIVPHSFEVLVRELQSPMAWCGIVFLHLNVKGCFFGRGNGWDVAALRIYVGSKEFEPLVAARRVELLLDTVETDTDRLEVRLEGDEGPYGTRNFRMALDVVPYGDRQTLVHLRYSLVFAPLARIAKRFYFAGAGRDRVGFTVERYDTDGQPVYIGGARGMIERNVMRFYLALQAYLDTLDAPAEERLDARLQRWFELTDRYPRQLRELDKESYLENKRREYEQMR